MKTMHSKIDESVNIIVNGFEARFVQRERDYFIVYLSSQKGCAQTCRMCHLTATGQTDETTATEEDYVDQIIAVMKVAGGLVEEGKLDPYALKKVHINFMSRGEPMENPVVTDNWATLVTLLEFFGGFPFVTKYRNGESLPFEYIISTIFPKKSAGRYLEIIRHLSETNTAPRIYYSLYSLDPGTRKKWVPRAADPELAFSSLSVYHDRVMTLHNRDSRCKIHHAIIKGVNDDTYDAGRLMTVLRNPVWYGLDEIPFNIVRYNPYDLRYGEEASEETIALIAETYRKNGHETQVVSRVGTDVHASCGMFVGKEIIREAQVDGSH